MSEILDELVSHLNLEKTGDDTFQGFNQDLGLQHIFGGLVLAQSLMAAGKTVSGAEAHSMHAYFLLPGDIQKAIHYHVDRIRDGSSFRTRRVVAVQGNRTIFNMSASFHRQEEGFEHQADLPDVPGPEGLASTADLVKKFGRPDSGKITDSFFNRRPVEVRPVEPGNYFKREKRPPLRHFWLKADGSLPDDSLLHKCVLAYASDFGLLETSLLPHGMSFMDDKMQVASLNHVLWFHRDFRLDGWFLYRMESPSASGARGFSRGTVFARDGKLIASSAQEGLVRKKRVIPE